MRLALSAWRGWLLILAVTVASAAFGLLHPWPLQVLVDHILTPGAEQPAWLAALRSTLPGAATVLGATAYVAAAGLLIFAVDSALELGLTRAWVLTGQRLVYQLAGEMFARVQRQSLGSAAGREVGDTLSRITGDSWCIYQAASALLFTPGHALLVLTTTALVMWHAHPGMTLVSFAVAPAMAAVAWIAGSRLRATGHDEREAEGRVEAHLHQTLSGIAVVQSFGQEERELRRFGEATGRAAEAQRRNALTKGWAGLATGGVSAVGSAVVLAFGAREVMASRLSLGELLVFLAYLRVVHKELTSLAEIWSGLQSTRASIDRVAALFAAPSDVTDRPGARPLVLAGPPAVRFEDVSFGYRPGVPVIDRLTLEIPAGATVAIVGGTGAGKSTLASLLLRFYEPSAGRITLGGTDVRDATVASVRAAVGVLLQEPHLFPFTVARNIALGRPEATRAQIEAAARDASAHGFISRLEHGYDEELGEHGGTLSGGERQRLAIARALLRDAPILILDEPTSNLDAETEASLVGALRRLRSGRTTMVIAHRLSTVRDADLIVVLEQGRLVEQGTHDQLVSRGGRYAELWAAQSRWSHRRPGEVTA